MQRTLCCARSLCCAIGLHCAKYPLLCKWPLHCAMGLHRTVNPSWCNGAHPKGREMGNGRASKEQREKGGRQRKERRAGTHGALAPICTQAQMRHKEQDGKGDTTGGAAPALNPCSCFESTQIRKYKGTVAAAAVPVSVCVRHYRARPLSEGTAAHTLACPCSRR